VKTISVKAITNDWITEMDFRGELKPEIFYRFADNAARMVIGPEVLKYNIALLDVDNFTALMPKNFHSEMLVAAMKDRKGYMNKATMTSFTKKFFGTDCEIEVNLLCPSCHKENCNCKSPVLEIDVDDTYLDMHPYLKQISDTHMAGWAAVQDDGFPTTDAFRGFELMKPMVSGEILWNMEYYLGVCQSENLKCNYSYRIEDDKFITDLKEGQIVMAYFSFKRDSDGYLLIPDDIYVIEAIKNWISYSFMKKEWVMGGNQNNRLRWLDMKNEALSMLQEAKSKLKMPTSSEWFRLMTERWVVSLDRYYY
jgi:hypothetical protein